MQQSRIYLAAAVLSLFFYMVGLMSGLFIEKSMTGYTEKRVNSLQSQMENLQLEYVYLSIIGEDISCDSLSMLVSENTEKVWKLGQILEAKTGNSEDLTREYARLSTKAWILTRYMRDKCKNDVVVVLYFYSVPCQDCIEQGKILDELREKYFKNNLTVFVLNSDLDEPIVNMLKKTNHISGTPALVIENKTYIGLIGREKLKKIISKEMLLAN